MWHQDKLDIQTRGRESYDITADIGRVVKDSGVATGLCHVFIHHTSASLMMCENADPVVRTDLESFMQRITPDGDPLYKHRDEGPDDMPAHVRTLLTETSLSIPVSGGRLALGTWQGVYLWEHRVAPHHRRVTVTIHGE
jgi:secondary thiamine-phosphate synthase enzyme